MLKKLVLNSNFFSLSTFLLAISYAKDTSDFERLNKLCNKGNKKACKQLVDKKSAVGSKDLKEFCQGNCPLFLLGKI